MTKNERKALVNNAQFPYAIEFRPASEEEFRRHSYIQTPSDERVFVRHANPKAEYRIRHRLE